MPEEKIVSFKEIGKILFLMKKCLFSHCFTSTLILKDFLKILLPILQTIEDEINLIAINVVNVFNISELFQLRNDILSFLEIFCDYDYSIYGLSNIFSKNKKLLYIFCKFLVDSYKENYYLVEDIPSVSKHQEICKFLSNFLELPNLFMRKFINEQEKIPTPSKTLRKSSVTTDPSYQNNLIRKDSEVIIDPNFNYTDENILSICKSINLSLRVIAKMAKNLIGQNVLLYTDYLRIIPIKPSPMINLGEIFFSIIKILTQDNLDFDTIDKMHYQFYKILENMLFTLVTLTLNPNPNNGTGYSFCNSEKRKNALKCFIFEKNKNFENYQTLLKSISPVLQNYGIKSPINASTLDHFSVLNKLIDKKFSDFNELLSRNLFKKDEKNFIICKKIIKKLHISSMETNILLSFFMNSDYKKDIDKNIELPNPRDLMTKFEDLNKFMMEKKHLKNSKNSVIQIDTVNSVNYTDKIIKTIQKKIEKSIYELVYEEKKESWKESRLIILNIMNISINSPAISSFSCPYFNEMNLKYMNFDNITTKNILSEKKAEESLSCFICIKYHSKSHFIQNFLKNFHSLNSEIYKSEITYCEKFQKEYDNYQKKPFDINFSLRTSIFFSI